MKGLLGLYEANFDRIGSNLPDKLQNIENQLFWDSEDGGYFIMVEDSLMILRMKDSTLGCSCGNFSLAIKHRVL